MVISAAKKQYLNMTTTGEWDKLDPRDAQMIALLITIKENTERQFQGYDLSKKTAAVAAVVVQAQVKTLTRNGN